MKEPIQKSNIKKSLMIIICIIFIFIEVKLDLKIPEIMSDITMDLQNDNIKIQEIIKSGMKMLMYSFGSILSIFCASVITAKISSDFSAGLRSKLFKKTQDFSFNEINHFSIPSLITRTTNDIFNIENVVVLGIINTIKTPIVIFMALNKINSSRKEWSTITAFAILIIIILTVIGFILAYNKYASLQQLTDEVNLASLENINGLYTIRANNFEPKRYMKFIIKNDKLSTTERFTNVIAAGLTSSITFITNILTVIIYYSGAQIITDADFDEKMKIFSDMIVYSTYSLQIISAIIMMIIVLILIPRAAVSFKRISAVLNEKIIISEGKNVSDRDVQSIEFRNVCFRYPSSVKDTLSDLNFNIKKGETLAIIGSTGCGKTTLVNLIMRFYDVSKGELLINGTNIKDYTFDSIHKMIGYVPQKSFLFSGTVASNVSYGSDEENYEMIDKACKAACVSDFTNNLTDKYKSHVNREGNNFSGGQKQRISIARALYNTPPILIFDDSFSALDYKTDKTIRNNIKNTYKDSIKIIVSQRISTIIDAEKIIVLENGCISDIGTHDQLLQRNKSYKQFAEIQNIGGTKQ